MQPIASLVEVTVERNTIKGSSLLRSWNDFIRYVSIGPPLASSLSSTGALGIRRIGESHSPARDHVPVDDGERGRDRVSFAASIVESGWDPRWGKLTVRCQEVGMLDRGDHKRLVIVGSKELRSNRPPFVHIASR